eukprot:6080319-Prymnesium_polylepis.1
MRNRGECNGLKFGKPPGGGERGDVGDRRLGPSLPDNNVDLIPNYMSTVYTFTPPLPITVPQRRAEASSSFSASDVRTPQDRLEPLGIRPDIHDPLHVHKVVLLDDDRAGRLLAFNDKSHCVPIQAGRKDLTDKRLVVAALVLEADRVVDIRAIQFDQHLLVDFGLLQEESRRQQVVAQIVRHHAHLLLHLTGFLHVAAQEIGDGRKSIAHEHAALRVPLELGVQAAVDAGDIEELLVGNDRGGFLVLHDGAAPSKRGVVLVDGAPAAPLAARAGRFDRVDGLKQIHDRAIPQQHAQRDGHARHVLMPIGDRFQDAGLGVGNGDLGGQRLMRLNSDGCRRNVKGQTEGAGLGLHDYLLGEVVARRPLLVRELEADLVVLGAALGVADHLKHILDRHVGSEEVGEDAVRHALE